MLMHTGICSNNRVGVLAKWGIILNLKTFIHQLSRYSGRSNIYVVVATSHPRSLINRNREKNFFAVPFVYSIHIRYFEGGKKKYILCCLLEFSTSFSKFCAQLVLFLQAMDTSPLKQPQDRCCVSSSLYLGFPSQCSH